MEIYISRASLFLLLLQLTSKCVAKFTDKILLNIFIQIAFYRNSQIYNNSMHDFFTYSRFYDARIAVYVSSDQIQIVSLSVWAELIQMVIL